jgi:four helix bundle protein
VDDGIRDFRDLFVWQRAIDLAKEVYTLTRAFPPDERFGMTSQLRRAVVSVSSNIAEGHARRTKEYGHFLCVARGSLAEVESQLFLAAELGYLRHEALANSSRLAAEIRRMLASLLSKIC